MVEATHSRLALTLAWLMALCGAMATVHEKWLLLPLSKQLAGGHYSLGVYAPGAQPFTAFSFGCVAALLMLLGAMAFHARSWRALGWAGTLLLWLAVFGALKATLTDARLLQALEIESTQQQSAAAYAQQALPVNFGSEPSVWPRLDLDTIEDRLIAAWYFVHAGWWAAFFGALLAIAYSAGRERSVRMPAAGVIGSAVLLLGCAAGPALGECALMAAHAADAGGDGEGAARACRHAMAWDPWLRLSINLYAWLGEIDAQKGATGTPEYHVYEAELPSTQMDLTAAIAELRTARLSTGDAILASVIRKREVELYTQSARELHALQAYGAAATASENALALDPASLLPAFYLSRDYFLIGRYRDAIALGERVLTRVDDPTFRANLHGNTGDAYTRLGDYAEAKLAYRQSYLLDYVLNLRGLAALNGPAGDVQ